MKYIKIYEDHNEDSLIGDFDSLGIEKEIKDYSYQIKYPNGEVINSPESEEREYKSAIEYNHNNKNKIKSINGSAYVPNKYINHLSFEEAEIYLYLQFNSGASLSISYGNSSHYYTEIKIRVNGKNFTTVTKNRATSMLKKGSSVIDVALTLSKEELPDIYNLLINDI